MKVNRKFVNGLFLFVLIVNFIPQTLLIVNSEPEDITILDFSTFNVNSGDASNVDYKYRSSADILQSTYYSKSSEIVNEYYSGISVNSYNNTIFVALTSTDLNIIKSVLEIMNPPEGVTVKFVNGYAKYSDLEEWINTINSHAKQLYEENVKLTSLSITARGKIRIGLEEINDKELNIIRAVLENIIPLHLIEVYAQGKILQTSTRSEVNRPLVGGIYERIYGQGTETQGSLGFCVTWNSGINHGILTCSHCVDYSNKAVYQPDSNYYIGYSNYVSSYPSWDNQVFSDSALISLDSNVGYSSRIWNGSTLNNVHGKMSYNYQYEDEIVTIMGGVSGCFTGPIVNKGIIYLYGPVPLYDQVTIGGTQSVQPGDSGSPVYTTYYNSTINAYTSTAYGIAWGRNAFPFVYQTYYSPIDGIESDLGIILDFSSRNWKDDFGASSIDSQVWAQVIVNGGETQRSNGRLQVKIPTGTGQAQAGYVTQQKQNINRNYLEINVPNMGTEEMILQICTTKTMNSDPYSQNEWYRCLWTHYYGEPYKWYVQKKTGGQVTNLQITPHTSFSTPRKLRIAVDDGYIRFYEDGQLRYVESYGMSGWVYVYIFTSADRGRLYANASGLFDDFVYQSVDSPIWTDSFQNLNNWDQSGGTAVISGGVVTLSDNAQLSTKTTFSSNRYVSGWVKTNTAGQNHWEVAFLQAKFVNWDNQVYALIWPDGTVELDVRYQGNQNGWATASGSVSNSTGTWHQWEFIISEDRAILKIDGVVKLDETHANFANVVGKVGLHPNYPASASYDNIVVVDG
jgi:hypothetical protein